MAASFGRGFYILDDYSVLRNISSEQLEKEATIFPPKKAWWYIQRGVLSFREGVGSQGNGHFAAPNPPFGAVFTYYLKQEYQTKETLRQKEEMKLHKQNNNIPFPGWEEIEAERRQDDPKIWLTVKDLEGNVINRVEGKTTKGFHRVAWDLTFPPSNAIGNTLPEDNGKQKGLMVAPGQYTVTLSKEIDGVATQLSDPMKFDVEQMYTPELEGASKEEAETFRQELAAMQRKVSAFNISLKQAFHKADAMQYALGRAKIQPGELDHKIHDLKQELYKIEEKLRGNQSKNAVGELVKPTINKRLNHAFMGVRDASYGPTPAHKESLEIALKAYNELRKQLKQIIEDKIPTIESALEKAGAPWTIGQEIPE